MFEILEHTADVGFRAWGSSVAELFENCGLALESIAYEMEDVRESSVYPIAAVGEDYESLLVNWLNELLYYLDGERVVMRRLQVQSISTEQVKGAGWGEVIDPERHRVKAVVKGVTYHQLSVSQEQRRWRAQVFLDI